MSLSPALSTSSSFSLSLSSSATSSPDLDKSFSKVARPVVRLSRPTHKRSVSDFTSTTPNKVRKTSNRSKNVMLWPSQLYSLDAASKEAKQRLSTPAMSRETSIQSTTSIQGDPVLLNYMHLLQQKEELLHAKCMSRDVSRQSSISR